MRRRVVFSIIFALLILSSHSKADTVSGANVVFIGSSTTRGVEAGYSYVTYLPDFGEPWSLEDVNLINSGMNGFSVRTYYKNEDLIKEKITDHEPNYILICLAPGDRSDLATYELHYDYLITKILEHNSTNNGKLRQIYLAKFMWLDALSDEEMALIPKIFEVITNITIRYDLGLLNYWSITKDREDLFVDGVHPNVEGATVIASYVHNETASEIKLVEGVVVDKSETSESILTTLPPSASAISASTTSEQSDLDFQFGLITLLPLLIHRRKR